MPYLVVPFQMVTSNKAITMIESDPVFNNFRDREILEMALMFIAEHHDKEFTEWLKNYLLSE